MVTSKPSLTMMALGNASAASIALSFYDDDDSSVSDESSSDEGENQFEGNGASYGDLTAATVPYYEGEDGMEDVNYTPPEQAPETWSGKFMRGVVARAAGLIGAVVFSCWMMGGSPVDEDDVVGVTGMVKSASGGGSGCKAGAGGGGGGAGGAATGSITSAQMTTATQAMAVSAAQSAASSAAAGTSASAAAVSSNSLVAAITGASAGVKAVVMISVAAVAVAVGIGAGVAQSRSDGEDYCPGVGSYKTHPGRLDVYFRNPLQTLTLDEGEELTDLVVDRYNDMYGCDRDYSRLMLDTTTIRCSESEDECCKLVITDGDERLLCEFDTLSTCAGCLSSEPLFADPENVQSGGIGSVSSSPDVGEWRSGVGCFNLFLSRSNSDQACVDVPFQHHYSDVETFPFAPTAAPATAYPTFSPSTSFPTLSPLTALTAFAFAGNVAVPTLAPAFN